MHIIFTSSPQASRDALQELAAVCPGTRLEEWLAEGLGLASLDTSWEALARELQAHPPVFIRHICPAYASLPLQNIAEDLDALGDLALEYLPYLDRRLTFSVQARLVGELPRPYGRFEVNTALAERLQKRGLPLDVRAPAQVVSVVCTPELAWLGVSRAAENLSSWAGGERRFKTEPDQVSRAEFKLLEAMETGRLVFPKNGQALDLGAAPGGWTRVLANLGLQVIAVDPAALDPRVAALPQVTHLRKSAQEVHLPPASVDVLVNDMRMDPVESVQVMSWFAPALKPGSLGVITLKLPEHSQAPAARTGLKHLGTYFKVLGARQLFHNRSEITAWFTNRSAR